MISIIIPYLNEEKNLTLLIEEIHDSFKNLGEEYEVILVDNGSTDGSRDEAVGLDKKYSWVHSHRIRTKGKGPGLAYGIKHAKGETIVFMDGDLQDDPKDILKFKEMLNNGYELVNGIRSVRKDNPVIKVYSKFANIFLKSVMHSPFTDINCGFKAIKKEIFDDIPLYENNFRFLPIAAFYRGYKVGEVAVNNRSRQFGASKYGIRKLFIGIMDTFNAYFLYQFSEKPLHFFGMIGGVFFSLGFLVSAFLLFERLVYGVLLYRRPGLQFAMLFIIVGIQIMMTGLIGELIVYLHKRKTA